VEGGRNKFWPNAAGRVLSSACSLFVIRHSRIYPGPQHASADKLRTFVGRTYVPSIFRARRRSRRNNCRVKWNNIPTLAVPVCVAVCDNSRRRRGVLRATRVKSVNRKSAEISSRSLAAVLVSLFFASMKNSSDESSRDATLLALSIDFRQRALIHTR
jgi:hypothetical protein